MGYGISYKDFEEIEKNIEKSKKYVLNILIFFLVCIIIRYIFVIYMN